MAVRDPRTEWIRVKIYRGMTPQRRLDIVCSLNQMGRDMAMCNIRRTHPQWSPDEMRHELLRRLIGHNQLAERVGAAPSRSDTMPENRADAKILRGRPAPEQEALRAIVNDLERCSSPYMIVGLFVMSFWGRPCTTYEWDVVVGDYHGDFPAMAGENLGVNIRCHTVETDHFAQAAFARRMRQTFFQSESVNAFIISPKDAILRHLRLQNQTHSGTDYHLAPEVYEVQDPDLDQFYLDEWAESLGVADLLARVRREAVRPEPQQSESR